MARYDAFILRIWRSGTGDEGQWAGRLEHLPDGEALRFSSLAALLAYLATELRHPQPPPGTTPDRTEADDRV
jgi:hypothetical protein